ncbi:MAG: hypothetical protein ACPGRZ_08735 [Alphaproteobacteria bacterium]
MYIGAASGAVTIGLAVLLVIMSQKPDTSKADQPPPTEPVVETPATAAPPLQTAVTLPPPPAPAPAPPQIATAKSPPAAVDRPALTPRAVEKPVDIATVEPLKPRPAAAPEPVETAEPKPAPEPAAQVANLPPQRPVTAPPKQTPETPRDSTIVSRETMTEGRTLLKMLETGKGPVIEIAWPSSAGDRSRLYRLLNACHGMQTALLTDESEIFSATGQPGTAWRVNRDAVSGFVRRPSGVLTDAEQSAIRRIKAYHGMHFGAPVRLFPRNVDATLLGGIGQIVGAGYLRHKTIRARYKLSGDRVSVVDIRADGKALAGGIVLPRSRRCG